MNRDQFLLDAYEEKLAIARSTLVKAQREEAYWERQIENLKRENARPVCLTCNDTGKEGRHSICRDCDELSTVFDYRGEPPALQSGLCAPTSQQRSNEDAR